MRNSTVRRVVDWFKVYQGCASEKNEKLTSLYGKLIEEEMAECRAAFAEGNVVEIYDAVGDIVWVCLGYLYYANMIDEDELQDGRGKFEIGISHAFKTISFLEDLVGGDTLDKIINVIADSNFTKSKSVQTEGEKAWKIIKWDKYEEPRIAELIVSLQDWV